VLVDEAGPDGAVARSAADAPEIDGVVRIAGGQALKPGQFVDVVVEAADEHDLHARLAG
jgi:ribosomal protein S12 methylthiotransferase